MWLAGVGSLEDASVSDIANVQVTNERFKTSLLIKKVKNNNL